MRSDADGSAGSLVVGDDVVVREHVTIHRGTAGRETRVGSRVLLVVPPADGYGPDGNPPKIAGTDTLVFVVDILAAA